MKEILTAYEKLPKIVKIILQIFVGGLISGLYRIFRYVESKNTTTLVVGILAFIPTISLIPVIADLVTIITKDAITFCAE